MMREILKLLRRRIVSCLFTVGLFVCELIATNKSISDLSDLRGAFVFLGGFILVLILIVENVAIRDDEL